ncbi:MAG TPA: LCP family protein [Acidimicrobiales bacterium]|nr:LCP family protein [Acidimicrobiales bacterium]
MASPAEEAPPRRHRRWPRRLLIAANILVAVCIIGVAAGYGYLHYQFGRIDKIRFGGGVLAQDDSSGAPMNVLLVGSDSRSDLTPEEAKNYGSASQVGGQRSDTIIVLRIDPKNEKAAMLSIPRDLWVQLANGKGNGRINSAFDNGAPSLVQTIGQNLGIDINHYVQVDFDGFKGIVEALGGVQIYSPAKARDKVTGLNIPNPGCVTLDGDQALAFVRSRHYEYQENGRWKTDPTGDLGRIQRQQDFIRRVLKKANSKAKGLDVLALNKMVNTGIHYVKFDDALTTKDLTSLAKRFKSLDPEAVQMYTLPTVPANIGGAAVLRLKQPDAQQVIDQFLEKAPAPAAASQNQEKPPADLSTSSVRVRVLNGSGAEGQARSVSSDLSNLGFNIAGIGEASSFTYDATEIRYGRGQRDKALLVQTKVKGDTKLVEDTTLRSVDVVVITGSKFGGVEGGTPTSTTAAPAPSGKATTTTAAPQPSGPQC